LAEWPTVRLGDHVDLHVGFAFKSKEFTDEPEDIRLVRGANIGQGTLKWDQKRRFPAERYDEFEKYHLRPGDVVLAMDRPWIDAGLKWAVVSKDEVPTLLVQRVARLRGTQTLVHEFVRYVIGSPEFEAYVQPIVTGVNVPHISGSQIEDFRFQLPPVKAQKEIASLLGTFDELIENNRRRIEILEEMARLIYREWFVHFRFPGHEDVELVDSDLGPVPEGWEVFSLERLQSATPNAIAAGPFGSKLGRKDYVDEPGVPVIRGANLRVGGGFVDEGFVYVSSEKAETLTSSYARPGDVVVTQRGTLGQVGLIPDSARFDEYVLSQSQMKFTADVERVDPLVAYMQLATTEGTRRIQDIATGSGVPHINLTMFRELKFRAPPRSIQSEFTAVVGPMEQLGICLNRQNRTLTEARDLLLPRLISGELDVSDLDLDLDPVA